MGQSFSELAGQYDASVWFSALVRVTIAMNSPGGKSCSMVARLDPDILSVR